MAGRSAGGNSLRVGRRMLLMLLALVLTVSGATVALAGLAGHRSGRVLPVPPRPGLGGGQPPLPKLDPRQQVAASRSRSQFRGLSWRRSLALARTRAGAVGRLVRLSRRSMSR